MKSADNDNLRSTLSLLGVLGFVVMLIVAISVASSRANFLPAVAGSRPAPMLVWGLFVGLPSLWLGSNN